MILIFAPILDKGSCILFIGRRDNDSSPIITAFIPEPARRPANKRDPVPELPKFNGLFGGLKNPFTPVINF